ncbi:MAG TPA: hypothetical protein VJN96_20645 [Vicinamibacterales bacterium]|nr:hypothetical protein [Vicinamibacterales bacterium]
MFVPHGALKRVIATALMSGGIAVAYAQGDVTVRGCVERDAAASTPIYKLVTSAPVKIYRLTAPKDIDVAAHAGHTVDVTGAVSADPPGRSSSREPELVVKKLTMVSDKCGSALRQAQGAPSLSRGAVPGFRSSGVRQD